MGDHPLSVSLGVRPAMNFATAARGLLEFAVELFESDFENGLYDSHGHRGAEFLQELFHLASPPFRGSR